ncbi:H+/oligopeptide symporter [Handroanthus impetiginosus]|uniref:H+/oligopeptide symporter n=1 Tax=Handroanthus impetiginosus TaxID=429701 RepID=A0A2G9H850_9LAMI|nr:H+/oligopeptide symporter [Handroanthus impetiginosus]
MSMEIQRNLPSEENGHETNHQEQEVSRKSKGGLVTMPFIIANEAFEKVASYGLVPNMVLYLMNEYNMGVAKATIVINYWNAALNFMPLLGAFVADSFLGRFLTIGLGSIASLLGMIQLWLTAMIPRARPPPCDQFTQHCKLASPAQYGFLISSFGLMSIGAGGIRPCSLAFGGDQLDNRNNPDNDRVLESFFGWYYASSAVSVLIALTGIVYIQEHLGWKVGFGVPAILMVLSALLFFLASPLYIKLNASKSLLTGFLQVIVVAFKNRRLAFPEDNSNGYHYEKGSLYTSPTDKLRFLNKACIIKNPQDVSSSGVSLDHWNLCSIEQVEDLKALIKVIPLWSTGIMVAINIGQTTLPVIQANSMDRHITSSFQIPAGSLGMFAIITLAIWVILYDRVIVPLAFRTANKKKNIHLGVKLRMGIGIFLSCLAMTVSGIVEHVRRKRAIEQGIANDPHGVVRMSALWLVPQNCLNGLAEAFFAIAQTEFYYSEFPKSMSSIAASLFTVGMGVGNLLASVVLSTVDSATKAGGKESWISSNINKGHYEFYYWLLAAMTSVNLIYFVCCSWLYGPCVETVGRSGVERSCLEEEKSVEGHLFRK